MSQIWQTSIVFCDRAEQGRGCDFLRTGGETHPAQIVTERTFDRKHFNTNVRVCFFTCREALLAVTRGALPSS